MPFAACKIVESRAFTAVELDRVKVGRGTALVFEGSKESVSVMSPSSASDDGIR